MKIIFVCLGNICRSPMAEAMFKEMVASAGLSSQIQVDSAATSTYELGSPPDSRTVKELAKHGLPATGMIARQLDETDFNSADLILVMDKNNLRDAKRMAPDKKAADKVKLVYSLTPDKEDHVVADPWYTGNFSTTYADLSEALPHWLEYLKKKLK